MEWWKRPIGCLKVDSGSMKIVDSLEEIEIVPWYLCEDCTKHSHFSSRLSALFFLQRFRSRVWAIDSLRRLIGERGQGAIRHFHSDEKVLDHVAQMLATGELHLIQKPLVIRTSVVA
jgi:hypothetical protein